MTKGYAIDVKQACKNRGVTWDYDEAKDEIILDGIRFKRMTDADDYLESKPRLDQ